MKKLTTVLSLVLGLGLSSAQQVASQKTTAVPPAKAVELETEKKEIQAKKVVEKKQSQHLQIQR